MTAKKMTRRSFLKRGAAAALLAGTGPMVLLPRKGQAAADKGPIVFCTYGGPYGDNMQKHVIDPFVKKTGIQVVRTATPAFGKVKAMVDTGNVEWDVVDAEGRLYFRGIKQNLFVPLDWGVIGHKTDLIPGGAESMGAANLFYHLVLSWNKKKFNRETSPKSWEDFFKFPGKRCTRGEAFQTLEETLMGDGVPLDKVYPLDVERALRKLSTVKKNIIFWANTKMALDLLISNEVDFGAVPGGPIQSTMEAGEPLDFTWNQAIVDNDFLVIPRGSKNVEASMKFISHCMNPEIQAAFSTYYYMGPSNLKAFDYMPKGREDILCTSPKYQSAILRMNASYWAANEETVAKRFEQWITS